MVSSYHREECVQKIFCPQGTEVQEKLKIEIEITTDITEAALIIDEPILRQ